MWELVVRQAEPLHRRRPPAPQGSEPAPPPVAPLAPVKPALPVFKLGEKVDHRRANDLIPGLSETLGRAALQMDAKTHGRMKKGKLTPEARIDLHGMTLAEAHPALLSFILSAHARGARLVLVITGKGKEKDYEAPMPVRQGVLRHQVPQWLRLPPVGALVLQITPAHVSHGGGGAYYVYLRRPR